MKQQALRILSSAVLAGTLSLVACGDDGGVDGTMTPDASVGGTVNSGTYNHYVTNSLKLGANASEAAAFGFDLDGKAPTSDNAIGKTLSTFASQLNIDAEIAAALTDGQFILLHSIRADALDSDTTVSWQVYLGDAKASPDYTGAGTFSIKSDSPTTAKVTGRINGGKFTADPGKLTLELSLSAGSTPLRVNLNAARIEATVSANGCNGKIGGAIKKEDLENNILPFLADQLDSRIEADAGCRQALADCDATSKLLLGLFDTNSDRTITVAEVKSNSAVQGVLAPDVDVLKADGSAGSDNVPESVSIGLGFGCVKGTFTAAGE